MEEEIELTFDEFLCFLLIHAAYADYEFSDSEKKHIKTKFGSDMYEEIHNYYLEKSEFECLQEIMNYKLKHYPNKDQRKILLIELKAMFNADGEFNSLEKNLEQFLERIILN